MSEAELSRPLSSNLYPVLPLRDLVAFPHTFMPLHIGREQGVRAIEAGAVQGGRKEILLVTQKDSDTDPSLEAIYRMGTLATVMQWMKFGDGSVKALFECKRRARIMRFTATTDYLEAEVQPVVDTTPGAAEAIEAIAQTVADQFAHYVKINKQISPEAGDIVKRVTDTSELADLVASHLAIEVARKQGILETTSVLGRLQAVLALMGEDLRKPKAGGGERERADTSKRDARSDTRLRKLHVTRYAGRYEASSHDLVDPSWDQVETAIRGLDQFKRPYVWLLLGEGGDWSAMEKEGYLNIIGGNGIYSVDGATPSDGRQRLSVPKHSREKQVDVWLSDQGFSTAELFVCYELETIIGIAKYFAANGRLDPRVEWVTEPAVGAWDMS